MLIQNEILELLKADVVPALGCTEPVCVAYCAANAASVLEDDITEIEVEVSPGIYKNGMSAGIPNCSHVGLDYASALGAILSNPQKGLQLLEDTTEDTLEKVQKLINSSAVSVSVDSSVSGVYAKCTLKSKNAVSQCIVKDAHTNVIYLKKDDEVIVNQNHQNAGRSFGSNYVERLKKMTIAEIRNVIDTVSADELLFLLDGVEMNGKLAAYSEDHKDIGIGLADAMREEKGGRILSDDLLGNMLTKVISAAESRLDGCSLPTMSSSGAGTKGLVVIIPVYETAVAVGASEENTVRAIALAHLVNRYINAYIGKLSPMCTCVMASSTAASAGITYLLGGSNDQIGFAVKNMVGTVTGMICDGGKVGCSLKVAAGTSAALMSAITAVHNATLRTSDGILADTPEQCIKNLAEVGNEGMKNTDKVILDIMTAE